MGLVGVHGGRRRIAVRPNRVILKSSNVVWGAWRKEHGVNMMLRETYQLPQAASLKRYAASATIMRRA
jgi:hypothetical protein